MQVLANDVVAKNGGTVDHALPNAGNARSGSQVTHVVVPPEYTPDQCAAAADGAPPTAHVVLVSWLTQSKRQNARQPETRFRAHAPAAP